MYMHLQSAMVRHRGRRSHPREKDGSPSAHAVAYHIAGRPDTPSVRFPGCRYTTQPGKAVRIHENDPNGLLTMPVPVALTFFLGVVTPVLVHSRHRSLVESRRTLRRE